MVVTAVHHPRLDELVTAEHFVLQNHAGLRQGLRYPDRPPAFAVKLRSDNVLDFSIAGRIGFADEERQLLGEFSPLIDNRSNRVREVVAMNERLGSAEHSRIEMGAQAVLVDARNLLRQEGGATLIFIHACDPQKYDRDGTSPIPEELLRAHFRLRVGPAWLDGGVLTDALVWTGCRLVHQHRTCEDELLHLEVLKSIDQTA